MTSSSSAHSAAAPPDGLARDSRAPAAERGRPSWGGVGAAALLLVSEAAWVSLAVGAFADGTAGAQRPRVDLPYLAFALPALGALGFVALGRAWARAGHGRLQRATRLVVLAAAVVAGVALSAGLVAGLSAPGTTWAAALHPWAVPAQQALAARAVRWAWAIAVLAWARGGWTAVSAPSLRHSATSLVVGAAVFVVVFGHQAAGAAGFDRATASAGWLLFVFFPIGVTAAAWAHEREVERRVMRRAASSQSGAWLVALVAPLALVALAAFLVGGAAAVVGPAAGQVLHGVGAVLGAVGDWVFSHLPRILVHPGRRVTPATAGTTALHRLHTAPGRPHPTALGIALLGVAGALVLVLVAFGVRALFRWAARHRPAVEVDDASDSVFTWGHFGDQLRRALFAVLRRLARRVRPRRRPKPGPAAAPPADACGAGGDPVRSAYRAVLSALRVAGSGRAPDETPRELAARLAALEELAQGGASELGSLTDAYERVRYAGADPAADAAGAATDAAVLVRAFGGQVPDAPRGDLPAR